MKKKATLLLLCSVIACALRAQIVHYVPVAGNTGTDLWIYPVSGQIFSTPNYSLLNEALRIRRQGYESASFSTMYAALAPGDNGVAVGDANFRIFPLTDGAWVDDGASDWSRPATYFMGGNGLDHWSAVQTGFFGFRFDADFEYGEDYDIYGGATTGGYNYGWMEISMNSDSTFTVLQWAYNAVAGEGIAVGQVTAVPEPATYAMMAAAGALGLVLWRRRRA